MTILGLGLILVATAVPMHLADHVPPFQVPTFDYGTLLSGDTPHDVLSALTQDGIISLDNVPSYSQVRRSYLNAAAACAVSAQEVNAEFLLHKTLKDGTKRYTISTTSGQDADSNSTITDGACPGYKTVYNEFSALLELVVLHVATALDATDFTTTDGYGQPISSRKLVTDAVRLDHFHAYEAPSLKEQRRLSASSSTTPSNSVQGDDDFTIELHEDSGMLIAFATPAFYKVSSDGTKRTFETVAASGEDDSESGLIIQTRDGQRVRPVLKPDQVTLMVGTGYNLWVDASHQLPAVLHAVRMPEVETTSTQRLVRAWFGKMTLLPSYQRMSKQVHFDGYTNLTTEYVKSEYQVDHHAVGCAPGRRLVATAEGECTYQSCTPKFGLGPPLGCEKACNHGEERGFGCDLLCNCKKVASKASKCWQVCVKDLTTCDGEKKQVCSGMSKKCV
uniref:Uncharacterized protein n=1 Tax=Hyaloperonospora arabidopsidis (strain Emoy2) TaxID=559515 RepID=M4BTP4_HYAAE